MALALSGGLTVLVHARLVWSIRTKTLHDPKPEEPEKRKEPVMTIGQKVQLTPGGPVWRVLRINACAAYLSRREPKEVVKHNRRTGEEMRFTATRERVIAVSPNAFLYYPEEES